MKTAVIYSSKNKKSVNKVKDWGKRHRNYRFIEVSDSDSIKEAKKDGSKIVELDTPVVVKKEAAKKKSPPKKTTPKKKTKTSAVKKKTTTKKKKATTKKKK